MQAEQPTGDALKELRRQVLQNLIDRLLILGEARALNIEVSSSDVEKGIEDLKTANGWDGAQLQQALVQSGIPSIAAFRRQLREDMLQKQIMGIRVGSRARVNEEQVEAAVAREVGQGGQVQERRASHILLRLPLGAPADQVGEAVTKLTKIRSEAIAGETTFEDLARLHSEDGTAPSGGDLGWFSRGDLDPRFETTVEQLAIDEISEPFRTDFGMHLVKLQGIRGRTADPEVIERLRRQIRHRLREQEIARLYDHWVRGLRDGAHIEIRQLPRLP
jgi:peptidyl-prolyl cis-trans isomerase SurA